MPRNLKVRGGQYVAEYLPHGTLISRHWEPEYIELVIEVEEKYGYPICGGKKKWRTERADMPGVCKLPSGHGTDHPGEGRCRRHGGMNRGTHHKYSLIRHRNMRAKIEDYLESAEVMDIHQAVATAWAVIDEVLGEDGVISPDRAQEVVGAMSRIGTLIKQHHDITEGQKLVIEVPQFMEWSEHVYELAIRYIQVAGGDVSGFLREAQSYYSSAIESVIGDSAPALGTGDSVEAEVVLRPGGEDV